LTTSIKKHAAVFNFPDYSTETKTFFTVRKSVDTDRPACGAPCSTKTGAKASKLLGSEDSIEEKKTRTAKTTQSCLGN